MAPVFAPFACFLSGCSLAEQSVSGSPHFTFWRPASLAKNHQTIPFRPHAFGSSVFRFGPLILRRITKPFLTRAGAQNRRCDGRRGQRTADHNREILETRERKSRIERTKTSDHGWHGFQRSQRGQAGSKAQQTEPPRRGETRRKQNWKDQGCFQTEGNEVREAVTSSTR